MISNGIGLTNLYEQISLTFCFIYSKYPQLICFGIFLVLKIGSKFLSQVQKTIFLPLYEVQLYPTKTKNQLSPFPPLVGIGPVLIAE